MAEEALNPVVLAINTERKSRFCCENVISLRKMIKKKNQNSGQGLGHCRGQMILDHRDLKF